MEEARNVLEKLKSIIEDTKFQDNNDKISLYELTTLINEYINLINSERNHISHVISNELENFVKIYIKNNIVTVLINAIKSIQFEIMEDDIKVLNNDTRVNEPLNLIGRQILKYSKFLKSDHSRC